MQFKLPLILLGKSTVDFSCILVSSSESIKFAQNGNVKTYRIFQQFTQLCVTVTDIFIAVVTLISGPLHVVQTQNETRLPEDGTCVGKGARLARIRGSHYAGAVTAFSAAKGVFGYVVVAPLDTKVKLI